MSKTTKLAKANLLLDNACKQAGLDPVAVRVAMINAIKDQAGQKSTEDGIASFFMFDGDDYETAYD